MNRFKAFAIASCLAFLALAWPVQAEQWNKKTLITVREPLALPDTVLQPGKYMMELSDNQTYRHVVRVYTEDGRKLVATIVGLPAHQMIAANSEQFTFWETPPGRPPAMRTWLYPGDTYGTQFVYPPTEAYQIAQAVPPPPPVTPPVVPPAPVERPPAVAPPPPVVPPAVTRPALPVTASPLPLIALFGLLAAAGAGATRAIRKLG